jgi:hypothetical protein
VENIAAISKGTRKGYQEDLKPRIGSFEQQLNEAPVSIDDTSFQVCHMVTNCAGNVEREKSSPESSNRGQWMSLSCAAKKGQFSELYEKKYD